MDLTTTIALIIVIPVTALLLSIAGAYLIVIILMICGLVKNCPFWSLRVKRTQVENEF